jgi:predicted subunit of tRNA(5-methylaminomethyl-2-thiouridylate) methyltransferase
VFNLDYLSLEIHYFSPAAAIKKLTNALHFWKLFILMVTAGQQTKTAGSLGFAIRLVQNYFEIVTMAVTVVVNEGFRLSNDFVTAASLVNLPP